MTRKDYERVRAEIAKKYNKERLEDKENIRKLKQQVSELKDKNIELETKIAEQKEWIERLLEFTELSPDQIQDKIMEDRAIMNANSIYTLLGLDNLFDRLF